MDGAGFDVSFEGWSWSPADAAVSQPVQLHVVALVQRFYPLSAASECTVQKRETDQAKGGFMRQLSETLLKFGIWNIPTLRVCLLLWLAGWLYYACAPALALSSTMHVTWCVQRKD